MGWGQENHNKVSMLIRCPRSRDYVLSQLRIHLAESALKSQQHARLICVLIVAKLPANLITTF